jgi:hypothetical protein
MKLGFINRFTALTVGALALWLTSLGALAQPLVDAAWAVANIGKPGVVFIDFQGGADYAWPHPGAVTQL